MSTITNDLSSQLIYTGVWTNWSKGYIRGVTLTLTHRNGGLLTAFIALFVTLVARSAWRLFCYLLHIRLSCWSGPQDAVYHQRQAILRNADDSAAGLKYFVQLAWKWRNKSERLWIRVLPVTLTTVVFMAGFYVASVFSSQISTVTGDEVLISSPNCGAISLENVSIAQNNWEINPYIVEIVRSGSEYARQCYSSNSTRQQCSIFTKQKLSSQTFLNVSCPFPGKDRICIRDSDNFRVDTGLIDSNDDFGVNAAPKDRIKYRRVVECAPIKTDGHTRLNENGPEADDSVGPSKLKRATSNSSQEGTIEYLYGGAALLNESSQSNPQFSLSNMSQIITYQYPAEVPGSGVSNFDYTIKQATGASVAPKGQPLGHAEFVAIPELRRDDAQLEMFFLSANNVQFSQTCDDDWFPAHHQTSTLNSLAGPGQIPLYGFDKPVSVLACTEQHQYCNAAKKKCTTLASPNDAALEAGDLANTSKQNNTILFLFLTSALYRASLGDMVRTLQVDALKARNTLIERLQGPLPSDQWQQEALYWHDQSMAVMQRTMLEIAAGPSDDSIRKNVQSSSNLGDKQVCKCQKARSSGHTSFSVLGLSITFLLGGLIMLLELIIEPIVQFFQKRRKKSPYSRLEWSANEVLQMQRMAHEALGAGTWTGGTDDIPTTERGEHLAMLDISDENHPLLRLTPGPREPEGKPTTDSDAQDYLPQIGAKYPNSSGTTIPIDPNDPDLSHQNTLTAQQSSHSSSHGSTYVSSNSSSISSLSSPEERGSLTSTSTPRLTHRLEDLSDSTTPEHGSISEALMREHYPDHGNGQLFTPGSEGP